MIAIRVLQVDASLNHMMVQFAKTGDDIECGEILNFDISHCNINPIDWIAQQLVSRLYAKTEDVTTNSRCWDLENTIGRQYTYTAEDLNRIDPTIPNDGSINDLKCIIIEVLDELGIKR